jgi:hypothetical protein
MQRLPLFLSVAALGLSGWVVWSASALRCEVRGLRSDLEAQTALEARVAAVERDAAARAAQPAPPAAIAPASDAPTLSGTGATGASRGVAPAPAYEELAKRVDALEKVAEKAGANPLGALGTALRQGLTTGGGPGGNVSFKMPSFYGSVEDAAKDLQLNDGQKSDFERAIADAKRDLDDLHRIPNDEGRTWEDVRKDVFKMDGGSFRFDMSKMESFKAKNVPGRSETYGSAERRIKDQAKSRMRDSLTRDQQAKFDGAQVDPLLGGGGPSFMSATIVTAADDADDGK